MYVSQFVLFLCAAFCFLCATFNVKPVLDMKALGLAFLTAALMTR